MFSHPKEYENYSPLGKQHPQGDGRMWSLVKNTHIHTQAPDAGAGTRAHGSLHVHEDGYVVLSITTLYVGIHPRGLWTGS